MEPWEFAFTSVSPSCPWECSTCLYRGNPKGGTFILHVALFISDTIMSCPVNNSVEFSHVKLCFLTSSSKNADALWAVVAPDFIPTQTTLVIRKGKHYWLVLNIKLLKTKELDNFYREHLFFVCNMRERTVSQVLEVQVCAGIDSLLPACLSGRVPGFDFHRNPADLIWHLCVSLCD